MSSIESKRVQYRKYLERAGVIDALSKALIKLYEEQNKPEDAIRFVRKFMCEACPDDDQFDMLKADLEEAKQTISNLEQDVERLRSKIKLTPEEIAEALAEGYKALVEDEANDKSLLRKYLTTDMNDEFKDLTTPNGANILDCLQSGFDNHNSNVGIYAADPQSYDVFNKLFDPIIRDYHNLFEVETDVLAKDTDWGNKDEIDNLDPERRYILSTRMRIARNLTGYPFYPKLSEKQFLEIEEKVKASSEAFYGEHTGAYFSINDIDVQTQNEMVARHILFKRGDPYLTSAGCYRFWPTGRGIFYNPGETFMIWVNEEDHLRIISMAQCGDLGDVYNRLITGIQELEKQMEFEVHQLYGNVTTCPTNLGTTLRASVHIRLPLLSQNMDYLKKIADEMNLQIRGVHGEHSEIEDGVMDISNKKRLGLTEFECVKGLQDGVVALITAEEQLESGGGLGE